MWIIIYGASNRYGLVKGIFSEKQKAIDVVENFISQDTDEWYKATDKQNIMEYFVGDCDFDTPAHFIQIRFFEMDNISRLDEWGVYDR